MTYEDVQYEDEQVIVDTFGKSFSSVYLKPNELDIDSDKTDIIINNYNVLNINSVSVSEATDAIKKLKNKIMSGFDMIPSFIIKDCSFVFANLLQILFSLALKTNNFPKSWKLAKVCPVFKNGDYRCVSNYRAIAILSNISKVFEIVLFSI